MAYIFISFGEHLDRTANSKNEFYNLSLNEQYELLKKRIPLERQIGAFRRFIECCFPTGMPKKYFISCPNFLREKKQSGDNKPTYLNNVVIRPELTLSMKNYLPDNQNIILIGDIYEGGKLKKLQVKGIQLIDSNMSSPNDMIAYEPVCLSFERGTWSINNVDWNDTFFTPNKVYELIESCYTVKNPIEVRQTFDAWNQYIEFRKYYLDEQSKRNFELDSAEYVEAYAVNRKDYRKNSSIYDDYILDEREEFTKGEMVVLSSPIEDAEPFPLVRLNIDRNKKAFNEAKILKRGKEVNEEERKIRSLASDTVFITTLDPKGKSKYRDKDEVTFGELLDAGYALGDRFRIISYDILPEEHLEKLQQQHDDDIDRSYRAIDAKYEKIVKDELSKNASDFEKQGQEGIKHQLSIKKQELDSSLENDVRENTDSSILSKINKLKSDIKSDLNKKIKQDKKGKDADYQRRFDEALKEAYSEIDVRSLYVERNINKLEEFNKMLIADLQKQVNAYKQKKQVELTNKYKDDVRNEKISSKENLDSKLKADKERVIDEETIIRFSLYFRLGDSNNIISQKEKNRIPECRYIVYDNRAEKAKIIRQETALNNFYSGFVKNPYLSTYLFNPETLGTVSSEYNDWMWYLESLNEKQKEAVRKAVSSNGIFLLQGPPGTGKTQVIAETVAQMVKLGKKVLISSETHKAIDNVFDRLPKIAEIVPIRLIPSNNDKKKDNEYDPKFLVDNFYLNIGSNMKKAVDRYKNFRKNKEEFSDEFDKLKLLKAKTEKSQKVLDAANKEIEKYEKDAKELNSKISSLEDKRDDIRIELDVLRRTKRHVEHDNLRPDEDVNTKLILAYREELESILNDNIYAKLDDLGFLVQNINRIKLEDIDRETAIIDPKSNKTMLEIKIKEVKHKMDLCRDDLDDVILEKREEYGSLKKELIALKKEESAVGKNDNDDLKLKGIFDYSYLVDNVNSVKKIVDNLKERIAEVKAVYIEKANKSLDEVENKFNSFERQITGIKEQVKRINDAINEIQDRDDVKDIQENKYKLESSISKFFKDFEISEPYNDIKEALKIISNKWDELENDFTRKEAENKEKIPMYEKISNYLSMEDVIEADRKEFTKDLFENVNVFGITCTSNDRFSGRNVDALSEYNIDDIDIKSVGIDVVIIDEVSKSSFIDLLIPILYGKTVILVGDHRQLPPMYEFSKLRDDDFEGLDETIINKDINKKFTDLYEECFFKTLFEKIPDSYKTMLVQQYRCHEHIMNVFNHFYQGQLKLGWSGQNNNKQHNIKLISNGRSIIEPNKHIYFVDCKQNETHEQDSTSMYNSGEARVVAELIKKLNTYFKQNPDREKLSIGVICTYGDQARRIKELIKSERIKTDAFNTDLEKMIVSTVDDFQGDERDIIILSTVRNPERPEKSNPGFILAYQRINVALSRARRLLVMVGNRKYLESKGVINLPDVNGNPRYDRRNFRVYEEILSTIEQYGKVIEDVDVLQDKEARING